MQNNTHDKTGMNMAQTIALAVGVGVANAVALGDVALGVAISALIFIPVIGFRWWMNTR